MDLDERNAGNLLRGLRTEPPRPPGVDLGRAMRDGRRRRTTRRAAAGAGIALTAAAVVAVPIALRSPAAVPPPVASSAAPLPTAPSACTVVKFIVPPNATRMDITAADPSGSLFYGIVTVNGHDAAYRWRPGAFVEAVDVAGERPMILAAGPDGTAVGYANAGNGPGFLLRDGTATNLPGGPHLEPRAMNSRGAIVGVNLDDSTAVAWRDAASQPVTLETPGGTSATDPQAIDDDGNVVGNAWADERRRPYIWGPDGRARPLPVPPGTPATTDIVATSARGGWATGSIGLQTAQAHPVLWNLRTGTIETLPADIVTVSQVSAQGWVAAGTTDGRIVLLADGKRIPLPDGFGRHGGKGDNTPYMISTDGTKIAGVARNAAGKLDWVYWSCR